MSYIMRKFAIAVCTATLLLWATVVAAHHSAAQFDLGPGKSVTVEGIVKEFVVRNPHARAVISVTDAKGTRDIEYEGHSASHFYRAGYTRDMVHVGDKIAILYAPRKDGNDGGYIVAFTCNGKTVGFGGLSPETGKRTEQK